MKLKKSIFFLLLFFTCSKLNLAFADYDLFVKAHPRSPDNNQLIKNKQKEIECYADDNVSFNLDKSLKKLTILTEGETQVFKILPNNIKTDSKTYISFSTNGGILTFSNEKTKEHLLGDSYQFKLGGSTEDSEQRYEDPFNIDGCKMIDHKSK